MDQNIENMAETIKQLEDTVSLLENRVISEVLDHERTKRRLAARERELDRMRSNLYKTRVDSFMKDEE